MGCPALILPGRDCVGWRTVRVLFRMDRAHRPWASHGCLGNPLGQSTILYHPFGLRD